MFSRDIIVKTSSFCNDEKVAKAELTRDPSFNFSQFWIEKHLRILLKM